MSLALMHLCRHTSCNEAWTKGYGQVEKIAVAGREHPETIKLAIKSVPVEFAGLPSKKKTPHYRNKAHIISRICPKHVVRYDDIENYFGGKKI